jgi:hypothetical protein
VLGALIAGVAGWQLLSPLNADSHGDSQLNAGSHGESSSAVGTQAFAAHGVSFTYPTVLHHLEGDEVDRLEIPIFKPLGVGDPAWTEVFALDEESLVAVYPYPQPFVMTSEIVAEYARRVGGWKPSVSNSVLQGLPMLHLTGGEVPTQSGTPIRSDVTMVYSGSMNYTVECLSSASTSVQILGACTHIIESLRVPSSSTAGWHVLSGDDGVQVSVPAMWSEESSYPASVSLVAELHLPQSRGYVVSLWITLYPASFFTQSENPDAMADALFKATMPQMQLTDKPALFKATMAEIQLTDKRAVRLPIGMAHMVILKDDLSNRIGYVVIKDQTAVIVTFTFAPGDMRLVRSTIEAVVRTLTLD